MTADGFNFCAFCATGCSIQSLIGISGRVTVTLISDIKFHIFPASLAACVEVGEILENNGRPSGDHWQEFGRNGKHYGHSPHTHVHLRRRRHATIPRRLQ